MAKIKRVNKTPKIKAWWIVLAVVIILALWVGGTYNSLVSRSVNVDGAWADVETQYQRRADLVPNLVATVQGAADFEQETQTQIASVRTSAVAAQQAVSTAQNPQELQAAAQQVEESISAFRGLNINVEAYPQLRGVESFLSLQDELAGTENRVQVARQRYNDEVRSLNKKVMRFPSNIIASMFGFEQREFFEADAGSSATPEVVF